MQTVEPPFTHCLSAAEGWLGLGDIASARAELESIPEASRNSPDVLEVHWMIYAKEQNWPAALDVAQTILQSAPDRSSGWLHSAYAMRRVNGGGLKAALETLLPAVQKFPDVATIPYNLSCYACQLNELVEARSWLQRAIKLTTKETIKELALRDSDLKPLWNEIRAL